MDANRMKKIPYGITDYTDFHRENYYYVDKTGFLSKIESAGNYLFFLRPRRFGKSLLLSMMAAYYDVLLKNRFEELFKGTAVYDTPTEEQGKYLVLSFNFSSVDPSEERLQRSFLELIRKRVILFIEKYSGYLGKQLGKQRDYFAKEIEQTASPSDIMTSVLSLCELAGQKIYVIIDEYDNFANTLLTASGDRAYRDLTHSDGFLRSFFNVLKFGTTGNDAPIKRLFITGVSPVTMDDVTSGFNIGKNVSLSSSLDRLLGFTEEDVKMMVDYYKNDSPILDTTPHLSEILSQWYGNYRFSGSNDVPLFNSDMVLYFVDYCLQENMLPKNFIDRNVRIDYGKLRHLIIIDRDNNTSPTTNGNFSKLKQIIDDGGTLSNIAEGFPLKEMADTNNFNSLLFYFGLLTIAGYERDLYRLQIPNETVKHLFYDYIESAYKETGVFSIDLAKYETLISNNVKKSKPKPTI